jgi:uncharacterized protein YecT (DUF1311 family)
MEKSTMKRLDRWMGMVGSGTLVALAMMPLGAQAEPRVNCQNPSTNVEYKYCARLAYEASDRELNQVYRRITSKMPADEKKVLTTAQLAWIKFRDTNCEAEVYPSRGGSGYGGFLSNCLERVTRARTAELKQQFEAR